MDSLECGTPGMPKNVPLKMSLRILAKNSHQFTKSKTWAVNPPMCACTKVAEFLWSRSVTESHRTHHVEEP